MVTYSGLCTKDTAVTSHETYSAKGTNQNNLPTHIRPTYWGKSIRAAYDTLPCGSFCQSAELTAALTASRCSWPLQGAHLACGLVDCVLGLSARRTSKDKKRQAAKCISPIHILFLLR